MAGNPEAASNGSTTEQTTEVSVNRRCAAIGRSCLVDICPGPQTGSIAYGGQGGMEEAGGTALSCPRGQEPDLHAELYY